MTDSKQRVSADGFAVIRRTGADLDDGNFVPTEDAVVVVDHLRKTYGCVILAGPWAAIGRQHDPNLIVRYAADDPEAVAGVRLRHAEKRAALCP